MASKTVFITGATGLIGRVLVDHLLQQDFRVKALARPGRPLPAGVERIEVPDITLVSEAFWREVLESVDAVVHAAAQVHQMDDRSGSDSGDYYRVNTLATSHLAHAAARAGVSRFIFISSIKVMGESSIPGSPFKASDAPCPKDVYGESKLQAEEAIHAVCRHSGMSSVIIRPPLCYGPGVKANFQALIKLVKSGLPLPLGAVGNRRSMVSVYNLVDLIAVCIEYPEAHNETFLVSDGDDVSTAELIRRIGLVLNRRPILVPVPQRWLFFIGRCVGKAAIVHRLCGSLQVDIEHTKTKLGWTPPYSMLHGLQKTFLG